MHFKVSDINEDIIMVYNRQTAESEYGKDIFDETKTFEAFEALLVELLCVFILQSYISFKRNRTFIIFTANLRAGSNPCCFLLHLFLPLIPVE